MLLWVPEGTDAEYLSKLPESVEVGYLPKDSLELPKGADRVEFLIAEWIRDPEFFAKQLKQLTNLKVVQTYAAGVDRLISSIPEGVILCNGRGLHDTAVSEWIVGAILASYNKFPTFFDLQRKGTWKPVDTDTLEHAKICIVGYGSIGKAVEKRLSGFNVEVVRVARTARTDDDGKEIQSFKNIESVLDSTDILVNILPLTPETDKLIDAHLLSKLPDGALVVNAGRGRTVDTDALISELESGSLSAILDTTEPEPIPNNHKLWSVPNLFLTQHSSGNSTDYLQKISPFIQGQLRRYITGDELMNIVSGGY